MEAYIAGKISGDSTYREKFKTAEQALSNQGFVVLNPADLPEGMNPADYMRICFAMMESADIVAFLPDYEQSRGAQLEWSWCQYAGKQTMYLESMSQKYYIAHEVAELLAEVIGDRCACNVNGNDEWLPMVCDFGQTVCPNVYGVACWEQYLKHHGEREEGADNEP